MTFGDFCEHLRKIEATPKRLLMTSLLSELLKLADSNEVDKVIMLSLGRLAPLYKDIDFGLAEKTVIRAIALASNVGAAKVVEEFKRNGDLGEAAMTLINIAKITKKSEKREPSVTEVFEKLMEIAEESGEGSQEKKVNKTADLLWELDPLGAKYAVRIILGNLRLGFSDKTVLDALSVMLAGDKSAREKLEQAYNVRPDIGWITSRVKSFKLKVKSLDDVKPELGVPILPALCQRLPAAEEIIDKMKQVAVEPKWDGQRIQAHAWIQGKRDKGKGQKEIHKTIIIKLFTRSLEDVTEMFPDLTNSLQSLFRSSSFFPLPSSFILDGEAAAIDPATGRVLPFQTMITRKRKYGIVEKLAAVPIKYMVFDILYLNGKSLMEVPFAERRRILEKVLSSYQFSVARLPDGQVGSRFQVSRLSVSRSETDRPKTDKPVTENRKQKTDNRNIINIAPQLVTSDPAEIRKFLKQQIDNGLEGIVAKRSDAPYIPGRTQFAWVKLKWEGAAKSGGLLDTVDCVVMGTYSGRGKRSSFGVGAFLVGIYSPNSLKSQNSPISFLTLSKIGTGLTDEQWKELKVKGQRLKVKDKPKEYEVPKELTPDTWLRPELVVEIQADNITKSPLHTAGYALRFPRLVRYRTDKLPEQITTLEEVKKLYEMSLKH